MINLNERMLLTRQGSNLQPPDHQSNAHQTASEMSVLLILVYTVPSNMGLQIISRANMASDVLNQPMLIDRNNYNSLVLMLSMLVKILADNILKYFSFFPQKIEF